MLLRPCAWIFTSGRNCWKEPYDRGFCYAHHKLIDPRGCGESIFKMGIPEDLALQCGQKDEKDSLLFCSEECGSRK